MSDDHLDRPRAFVHSDWQSVEVIASAVPTASAVTHDLPDPERWGGVSPHLGAAFQAALDSGAASVEDLCSSHDFTLDEAEEWYRQGFGPHSALMWRRWGFTPSTAASWKAAGEWRDYRAWQFLVAGCSPAMLVGLRDAALSRNASISSIDVAQVEDALAFQREVRERGGGVGDTDAASWVSRWWDGTWERDVALTLATAGVTFAQAQQAASSGLYSARGIIALVRDGVSLEDAKALASQQ